MTDDQLAPDLERFLNDYVHSYEELAVLLLLFRERLRGWTSEEVAGELKIHEDSALSALEALRVNGLVGAVAPGRAFRYEPSSEGLDASVSELERFWCKKRFAIVETMNRLAFERMRHSVAQAFSGGFRVPGPKK